MLSSNRSFQLESEWTTEWQSHRHFESCLASQKAAKIQSIYGQFKREVLRKKNVFIFPHRTICKTYLGSGRSVASLLSIGVRKFTLNLLSNVGDFSNGCSGP